MQQLTTGCRSIGRNLNDTRGLLHSFRDCRLTMLGLFSDLHEMMGAQCMDWELAFELRIKRSRHCGRLPVNVGRVRRKRLES